MLVELSLFFFPQVDINNWMVVCTKRDQQKAMDFVQTMKQCCPQMGIQVCVCLLNVNVLARDHYK